MFIGKPLNLLHIGYWTFFLDPIIGPTKPKLVKVYSSDKAYEKSCCIITACLYWTNTEMIVLSRLQSNGLKLNQVKQSRQYWSLQV